MDMGESSHALLLRLDVQTRGQNDELLMQIFVQTPSGKSITIAVDGSDSVSSVKREIEAGGGAPVYRQSLVYNGREMRNEQRLQNYHVLQGSTLHLYLRLSSAGEIRLRVRQPLGEVVSFTVGEEERVKDVKAALEARLGVPLEQQQLSFRGQQLENQVTLSECGIQDGCELGLRVVVPITVKTLTGQAFPLEVATNESVPEVKNNISKLTKISPECQRLICAGKLINDNSSLDNYEIESGADLYVIRRLHFYNLRIKSSKGNKCIKLKVESSTSVRKVKKMIEALEGTPYQLQQLSLDGVCLEDRRRMGYYHRLISSKYRLVLRRQPQYQVLLRTLSGKTVGLGVRGGDRVEDVKSAVHEKEGIPPEQQRLLLGGRPLRDGERLTDCGLCSGSTVDITLSLLGGFPGQPLINVETAWGEIFDILLIDGHRETINTIKAKIARKTGIPQNQQQLSFNGRLLIDELNLYDYNIHVQNTLELVWLVKKGMGLIVKMKSLAVTIETEAFDTIESVKVKLNEKVVISQHQQLVFNGRIMEDGKTLSDYNVRHGDTLQLDWLRAAGMGIYIKALSQSKVIPLVVGVSDTIENVKKKIHDKVGLPRDQQQLSFNDNLLKDNRLYHYNINHEDTLLLIPRVEGIEVSIRFWMGKTFTLEVDANDTIEIVKIRIQSIDRLTHSDKQRLIYAGRELKNERTVSDYNIQRGSTSTSSFQ